MRQEMQNLECLPCSTNLLHASWFCPYPAFSLSPLTWFFSPREGKWPVLVRDPCPGDSPRDRWENPWFELAILIPALNLFELALLEPLEVEDRNITEGDMWDGGGGGSSAYHGLGLRNCFWGNILMQHWQPMLEYCKSMSSSCECFSNMSILSHFVSS